MRSPCLDTDDNAVIGTSHETAVDGCGWTGLMGLGSSLNISKSRVTKGFIGYCVTPAEIGPRQYEFWNILLSRSCRNENIVLLLSDYKSMFFKLSADIKFMPINLDLEPIFGDFVPPIRQVSVPRLS